VLPGSTFLLLCLMTLAPRNLLLILVALLVIPLAVAALQPSLTPMSLGLCALVLFIAGFDFAAAIQRKADLGVRFPEIVRSSKDKPANISFILQNERPGLGARFLRLGVAFPTEIETIHRERTVLLGQGMDRTQFEWPCIPRRRGSYGLDRLYFEEASLLGLWSVRRSLPIRCELRVYPNLLADRRQAAAVFLHRGGLGSHAMRQVGRGRDFEKLRDYIAGDSIEDISWKATARRQRPVSKVYQIERTQEVYVIVDRSRLNARLAPRTAPAAGPALSTSNIVRPPVDNKPPDDENAPEPMGDAATLLERYISSALLLCLAAERQGDLFGLVTFSDRVERFLRAKNGQAHFNTCRDAIFNLEPAAASPDFEELCAFLRVRLRRRALLIFLTSLDDPVVGESFTKQIELISRQHLVMVNMLKPSTVAPLFTNAGAVSTVDDIYERLGGHLQWQKLRERENLLRRAGVRFALLDHERMTEQLVTQYVNIKRRQIL
jgi:uncharacterized protein (DUF58 family)